MENFVIAIYLTKNGCVVKCLKMSQQCRGSRKIAISNCHKHAHLVTKIFSLFDPHSTIELVFYKSGKNQFFFMFYYYFVV